MTLDYEPSMEELRWTGCLIYRTFGTGRFYKAKNGKTVEERQGEEFIPTRLGEIPTGDWFRMMEAAAVREGCGELLEALADYCSRFPWLRNEDEIRHYALELLSSGQYNARTVAGKVVIE